MTAPRFSAPCYPETVVSFDQFVGAQDEARRDFKADVAPETGSRFLI
jgi:hypothetical protein